MAKKLGEWNGSSWHVERSPRKVESEAVFDRPTATPPRSSEGEQIRSEEESLRRRREYVIDEGLFWSRITGFRRRR